MAADSQDKAGMRCAARRGAGGFTLVELMVSTAIMLIVVLVLLQVVAGMTNIWHNTTGEISSFQSARTAFSTITRTLSRATIKTYLDYVDKNGNPITNAGVTTTASSAFVAPASFARASELWFVCGPTTGGAAASTWTAGSATKYPGDAVFFTAPMGIPSTATYKFLPRALNFVGFYVNYGQLKTIGTASPLPAWLATALGFGATNSTSPYRYRLMQYMEYSDKTSIYNNTILPSSNYSNATSSQLTNAITGNNVPPGLVNAMGENVVLAENIVLLIIRPRIEESDEQLLAGTNYLNISGGYTATIANSVISPGYNYDSFAWWTGVPYGPSNGGRILSATYAKYMRNQIPPIVDVAMVAVDPNSIVRLGTATAAPPTALQVPTTLFNLSNTVTTGANEVSSNMDADLATFGAQLAAAHIHYRVFRSSIQMEGAAWADN